MGTINIEGFGIIEIKGEVPDDEEQTAILTAIQQNPISQDAAPQADAMQPEPQVSQPSQEDTNEGPTDDSYKSSIRRSVEKMPGLMQLLTEIGPSTGGAITGAAVGSVFGPLGTVGGAAIGGLAGEKVAQETGFAPESDLNLVLSGAGPVAGPAVRGMAKVAGKTAGFVTSKLPFVKKVRAMNVFSEAVEHFESIGTKILDNQKGLLSRPASDLYAAVRRSGVTVNGKVLKNTQLAIQTMVDELQPLLDFPEVDQSVKALQRIQNTLLSGEDISIDTLVRTRQIVGAITRRAESAGGVKLGSSKNIYSSIANDMEMIGRSPTLSGRATRVANAAIKRAKLEFAVKDFEAAVTQFSTDTADGSVLKVSGLNKWLKNVTNPKSKQFDKNFTDALKDELPDIIQRLDKLMALTGSTAGGPGSLVVRGRLTSMAVGAMAGIGLGGPLGGAAGALIGTNIPEMLVAAMTTKAGAAFLEKAVTLGNGQIDARTWAVLGEIITRSMGEKESGDRLQNADLTEQSLSSGVP